MADVIFTNGGRNWIRDFIKDNIDLSGVGLDDTIDADQSTIFGGGTTIDACDATTGWSAGGDGTGVTLNTTDGEYQEGSGSLDLAITNSTGESTFTKTISSTDLSGDEVFVWIYVPTPAHIDNVYVVLGTGGVTDSNEYQTAGGVITTGWNSLKAVVDSPDSTNGSGATESGVDTIQLKIEHNTSPGTLRMDYWRLYGSGTKGITDSQKSPSISTGDRYVKTTHQILSTESNGLGLSSAADFDGSTMPFFMQFTEVSKDKTSELQIDKYTFIE